jgi:hypothetical protein
MDCLNQGTIDPVELDRQLLCAATRAKLADQCLGYGCKASDIGKQRRAMCVVGQCRTTR